jgi:hypothetical protein
MREQSWEGGAMVTLALDVDGVLLDPDRNGEGHWTNELTARFGIGRVEIDEAFFMQGWDDVVNGRRSIEDGLGEALIQIGATVDVESVLSCWFDADYSPFEEAFDLARNAAEAGHRVVLATNQEHRRGDALVRACRSITSSTPPGSGTRSTIAGSSRWPQTVSGWRLRNGRGWSSSTM